MTLVCYCIMVKQTELVFGVRVTTENSYFVLDGVHILP